MKIAIQKSEIQNRDAKIYATSAAPHIHPMRTINMYMQTICKCIHEGIHGVSYMLGDSHIWFLGSISFSCLSEDEHPYSKSNQNILDLSTSIFLGDHLTSIFHVYFTSSFNIRPNSLPDHQTTLHQFTIFHISLQLAPMMHRHGLMCLTRCVLDMPIRDFSKKY